MLKNEFIKDTANQSGHSQAVVRSVLEAAYDVTWGAISRGESVMLFGLGKLHSVQRNEKRARNLWTGDTVIVPPRRAVMLRASDSLIAAANLTL